MNNISVISTTLDYEQDGHSHAMVHHMLSMDNMAMSSEKMKWSCGSFQCFAFLSKPSYFSGLYFCSGESVIAKLSPNPSSNPADGLKVGINPNSSSRPTSKPTGIVLLSHI